MSPGRGGPGFWVKWAVPGRQGRGGRPGVGPAGGPWVGSGQLGAEGWGAGSEARRVASRGRGLAPFGSDATPWLSTSRMTDAGFREGLSKVNKTASGRELL